MDFISLAQFFSHETAGNRDLKHQAWKFATLILCIIKKWLNN